MTATEQTTVDKEALGSGIKKRKKRHHGLLSVEKLFGSKTLWRHIFVTILFWGRSTTSYTAHSILNNTAFLYYISSQMNGESHMLFNPQSEKKDSLPLNHVARITCAAGYLKCHYHLSQLQIVRGILAHKSVLSIGGGRTETEQLAFSVVS
ncbi:hypothetical protein P154DRAFT_538123 [Amniculicola lignicola CBS 123094]|uniref:Uncharacterized protein n=1 Tax=Amniculicola lignicola CBS 123094 TaxID=1392246 RepID=A0A6A5W618_9PLEO|nr:hypothetical protein P154DRAFT_538123 [Amniculicola lignicola CBS 123094]